MAMSKRKRALVALAVFDCLLLAVIVSLLNGHLRQALIALGYQRLDLRNTALSSGVHVLTKVALIPVLGIAGAALGTLIGEAFLAALSALTLRVASRDTSECEERDLHWVHDAETRELDARSQHERD